MFSKGFPFDSCASYMIVLWACSYDYLHLPHSFLGCEPCRSCWPSPACVRSLLLPFYTLSFPLHFLHAWAAFHCNPNTDLPSSLFFSRPSPEFLCLAISPSGSIFVLVGCFKFLYVGFRMFGYLGFPLVSLYCCVEPSCLSRRYWLYGCSKNSAKHYCVLWCCSCLGCLTEHDLHAPCTIVLNLFLFPMQY